MEDVTGNPKCSKTSQQDTSCPMPRPHQMRPCQRPILKALNDTDTVTCEDGKPCRVCKAWYKVHDALKGIADKKTRKEVADITARQMVKRWQEGAAGADTLLYEKALQNLGEICKEAERNHTIYSRLSAGQRFHPYHYDTGEEADTLRGQLFQIAYDGIPYEQDEHIRVEVADETAWQGYQWHLDGENFDNEEIVRRAMSNLSKYHAKRRKRYAPLESLEKSYSDSGKRRYEGRDAAPVDPSPYEQNTPEYNAILSQEIAQLPPQTLEILRMMWNGMDNTQIAEATLHIEAEGMSDVEMAKVREKWKHAVEQRIYRLRKLFRELLGR